MRYSVVADTYEAMEQTTKRLELTDHLVELFKKTPKEVIDKVVYLTQGKLYPDYVGIEIGVAERFAFRAIAISSGLEVEEVSRIYAEKGDLGEVILQLSRDRAQVTLFTEPLTVERVFDTLDRMARTVGQGSVEIKLRSLASLLNDVTPKEAKYIMRTATGELRLGVADYTVLDALAIAYTGDKANRGVLERAYNLSSDLGVVAKVAASEGLEGIRGFRIQIGKPIRPMLAERMETAAEILKKLGGKCVAEYKLDGERLQIHKKKGELLIFSRRLENITSHYPDAIELCQKYVRAKEFVIEAEAVAINVDSGEYLPFQELMHRRRKYGIEEAMQKYPISLNVFDVLYADGVDYTSHPYIERRGLLEKVVKGEERIRVVPALMVDKAEEMESFMEQAVGDGCEGIMVKDLNSVYRAGAREFAWIKLKREYRSELTDTIDLTIVGAFHGRGRRAGKYGAFLLAAYDKEEDLFRTACKIGTGFTDEDLERFPKLLETYRLAQRYSRVDSKMEADVWFSPKIVIETIASEITLSPIHTCSMDAVRSGSGLALRFPKFTGRIRDDKAPEDSTTTKEIVDMYRRQRKLMPS